MKKTLLLAAFAFGFMGHSYAQRGCSTMDNLDRLVEQDPRLVQKMDNLEQQTQRILREQKGFTQKSTITIPVVFHVLYNNSAENISDARVMSQLQVLQEDYNLQNSDHTNTPAEFANLVANVGINFVLADTDPQGNPHSGITRTYTNKSSFGTDDQMKYTSSGGHDAWPADQYLNFWVCDLGTSLLGYAQFPGGDAETDGVVCHYKYTGTGAEGAVAPFDLGRTATHEVGHWLNLRHIWGDAACGDDMVDDTPSQLTSSSGCPSHPQNSCFSNDMFMNYMDYVNDACMYMFSEGQKQRMMALFADGGFRSSFATGGGGGTTPSDYCTSKGNSVNDEWIANVSLNDFSNSTGANGGYADFTATQINLAPGSSVNLSLSPGFSGSSYNEYWKVWIDYNSDNDFDDAGELAFDAEGTSSSTVSGSFTVPANASGSTRMRVSMKYNGAQTACEAFSYGEVEDYTVVFGEAPPEVCDAPTSVSASNISSSSLTVNWTAMSNAGSYNVDFRAAGAATWSTSNVTGTSKTFSGLSAETSYEFRVQTVCSEGSSNYSSVSSATTDAPAPPSYCASSGSAGSEWIEQVVLGNVDNTSNSNNGYGDYTSQVISAKQGETMSISLNPGFSSSLFFGESTQPEYWRVYIDYNGDYDFDDAGELAYDAGGTSTATVSGSITIPATAPLGTTRVRVSMKRSSGAATCGSVGSGEVEDYSITITEASTGGGGGNPGGEAPTGYCASNGGTADEWIASVSIGGVNNNSGNDGGYGDYTSISVSAAPSSTVNFTLNPGFTSGGLFGSSTYPEYWRIWVDFNRDGDFDDAGELAFDAGGTSTSSVSGSFTVPAGASLGNTRMRVSMKYNGASTACEAFSYGEVEDYILSISTSARMAIAPKSDLKLYPNPVSTQVTIAGVGNSTVSIMDLSGRIIYQQLVSDDTLSLDTENWIAGLYIATIQKGNDTEQLKFVVQH